MLPKGRERHHECLVHTEAEPRSGRISGSIRPDVEAGHVHPIRSVEVELFPTAKGNFYAELTQVSMSKLWIHCAHEDLPRVSQALVKRQLLAIGDRPRQMHSRHEIEGEPGEAAEFAIVLQPGDQGANLLSRR